ncbi:MAG: hypothetical protein KDA76_12250 [Planctomycetaceae bacterium]|nr:hypothetical protein [Planctomycetaceae bacterium]
MTNEYLEIAEGSDAEYWTPPLLLSQAWKDAITETQQLLLRVPIGAAGDSGTVTLQAIAEYWVDATSVTGSVQPSFAYVGHIKASYLHDGVDSFDLTGVSDSLVIHQEDEFAETAEYSELAILLEHGSAFSAELSGIANLWLYFSEMPTGTLRIRAAKNSAAPTLPGDTTAYTAMTLTDAYVDVTSESGGGVGALTANLATVYNEVQLTVGELSGIILVVTPVGNEATGGLEATFAASPPANLEVGEPVETGQIAGPQGMIYEGAGSVFDADLNEITAQAIDATLSDSVDAPRTIVEFAWAWSPGVGEFEFADETMVRFRFSRLAESGTLAEELRIYTPIVTVGEAPAYGYGG